MKFARFEGSALMISSRVFFEPMPTEETLEETELATAGSSFVLTV